MRATTGDSDAVPQSAHERLRNRLGRALRRDEALIDRRGRPKAGPWLEVCAGIAAWRVLTQLPAVLADLTCDAETAPLLPARGLEGMEDTLARGVLAAKVASLVAALERERRGERADLVAQLHDEVSSLRHENERLRHAVDALAALAFAEAEAREGGMVRALPPPDHSAVLDLVMAPPAGNEREAVAAHPARADG